MPPLGSVQCREPVSLHSCAYILWLNMINKDSSCFCSCFCSSSCVKKGGGLVVCCTYYRASFKFVICDIVLNYYNFDLTCFVMRTLQDTSLLWVTIVWLLSSGTLSNHWVALLQTHLSCFSVVNLLEKLLHYRTEWNAFELPTCATHVKMHLAFKALHQESCCAAYCNISRTHFQILVGGRDTYQ